MNKKYRKLASLALTTCLLASVCACSKQDSSNQTNVANDNTSETQSQAKADDKKNSNSSDVEYTEVGTYPIVNQPIKMTMLKLAMPNITDYNTNDFSKFMEQKTNIQWDYQTVPYDSATEKVNLLLSSGDYPDAFMQTRIDVAKYGVKEGMLLQLDELIPANMPNYMKMSERGEEYSIDKTRQADGHIYSLAELNECYHCYFGQKLWVNTMWLDKLGVSMPTTTDELMDVCKKFLEVNPKGVAITGAKSGWFATVEPILMESFTFDPGQGSTDAKLKLVLSKDDPNKIETIANKEEYRDGIRFMNELYKAGALYDGTFTQDGDSVRSLMNQEDEPVLFVSLGTISDAVSSTDNPETYSHYRVVPALKGPKGVQYAPNFGAAGVLSEDYFFVTDKCKYPEAVLRWADYFYTYEGSLGSTYGPDAGTDWIMNPEGKKGLDGNTALYEVLNPYSSDAQNHDWQDVAISFKPVEFRMGQATEQDVDIATSAGLEKLLYQETKEKCEPYAQKETGDYQFLPSIKFTADESSDIATITVDVQKYISESRTAFITGNMDIEKDWDKYVQGLSNAGMDKLIGVYQTAYNRQFNK